MRNYTLQSLLIDTAIAACAVVLLGMIFRPAYLKEQAERDALEAEMVAERKAADLAYAAEVAAEKARWEAIEEAERQAAREAKAEPKPAYFNDEAIPDEVEEAAHYWGEVYGISPEFLEAVAWAESRFDNLAENGDCIGLMQVCPRWHMDRVERLGLQEADLWTVHGSMGVAADYLAELQSIHDDEYWVLMTYNGDSRAEQYLELTTSPSEYALTISELTVELIQLHQEGGSATWLAEM